MADPASLATEHRCAVIGASEPEARLTDVLGFQVRVRLAQQLVSGGVGVGGLWVVNVVNEF